MLEAADIRVPFGDLSVCYDPLGAQYNVPRFAFSNPTNILSDEEFGRLPSSSSSASGGGGASGGAGAKSRREYNGPVVDFPLTLRISATTSTTEQDVRMSLASNSTVGALKQALHEHLKSGRGDQKPDSATSRPNQWGGVGLPVGKQRVMFR